MPRIIIGLRRFDWTLFGAAVLLVVFGLAALYSTSLGGGGPAGDGVADFSNFWKQVAFAAVEWVIRVLLAALASRAALSLGAAALPL